MPAKRQSFLDKIEKELPAAPDPVAAPVAEPPKRAAAPAAEAEIVKTTIYIPKPVHARLREIAYTENRRVHDLVMEGLDRVIEGRGHPERTKPPKQ